MQPSTSLVNFITLVFLSFTQIPLRTHVQIIPPTDTISPPNSPIRLYHLQTVAGLSSTLSSAFIKLSRLPNILVLTFLTTPFI